MPEPDNALVSALRAVADGAPANGRVHIQRHSKIGTPTFWEERVSIRAGQQQRYESIRSAVDAGGAPIGVWHAAADPAAVRSLAAALHAAQFWAVPAPRIEPGEECVEWLCEIDQRRLRLFAPESSPAGFKLADVDLLFQRIANTLVETGGGAALVCELEIGADGDASVALRNVGNRDCEIQNPLRAAADDSTYLRIEVGFSTPTPPGVTENGIDYQPAPLELPRALPPPWDAPLVRLRAGERLVTPVRARLAAFGGRPGFVRGVYSHYGLAQPRDGLPLIRGCVFSNELELSSAAATRAARR
jgi:hypothetical protein